jgi:hypothetical protein
MHTTTFEWHMTRIVSYKGTLNGAFYVEIDISPILTQPFKSCNFQNTETKNVKKTVLDGHRSNVVV